MQASCIRPWRLHCTIPSRKSGSRISAPYRSINFCFRYWPKVQLKACRARVSPLVTGHFFRQPMTNLLLSPTKKYFRIGDKNDYCVLDGSRVIGRIFLHAQAGRPTVVLDHNSFRYSPVARQAGLFSNARRSDGGFQGTMGGRLVCFRCWPLRPHFSQGRRTMSPGYSRSRREPLIAEVCMV